MLKVELVYVTADKELVQYVCELPEGATVATALLQSGIWQSHPETRDMSVGIFSLPVTPDRVLKTGDRLEIYRPLLINPMEKRRLRAKGKK